MLADRLAFTRLTQSDLHLRRCLPSILALLRSGLWWQRRGFSTCYSKAANGNNRSPPNISRITRHRNEFLTQTYWGPKVAGTTKLLALLDLPTTHHLRVVPRGRTSERPLRYPIALPVWTAGEFCWASRFISASKFQLIPFDQARWSNSNNASKRLSVLLKSPLMRLSSPLVWSPVGDRDVLQSSNAAASASPGHLLTTGVITLDAIPTTANYALEVDRVQVTTYTYTASST